jgi:hypothetical protein
MAEYITQRVRAVGPRKLIQKLIDDHFVERASHGSLTEKHFDFETVIPQPAIVRQAEPCSRADLGAFLLRVLASGGAWDEDYAWPIGRGEPEETNAAIRHFLEEKPDFEKFGRLQLQCLAETGFIDWQGWNSCHWGTKWNASGGKIEHVRAVMGLYEMEFTLQTALSVAEPVWVRLAQLFPRIVFRISIFEAGWVFAGKGTFNRLGDKNGFEYLTPEERSARGQELYRKVFGREYRGFGFEQ